MPVLLSLILMLLMCAALPARTTAAVSLNVDGVVGSPGDNVVLDVSLSVDGTPVVATQNELTFPEALSVVSCRANEAIGKDATFFIYTPQGCTRGVDCTTVRVVVFSLVDSNPILDGAVLYSCTVRVDNGAQPGTTEIACSDPLGSTADATPIPADCAAAPVVIVEHPDVAIIVGEATGAPGDRVIVPVITDALFDTVDIIAIETELRISSITPVVATPEGTPDCSTELTDASFADLSFTPTACTPAVDCTSVHAVVVAPLSTPFADGETVFSCAFDISESLTPGSYSVNQVRGRQSATNSDGTMVGVIATDGEIEVRSDCVGDCNGDFRVPVSELVTGVNVLLDRAPIASCTAFDRDANGVVTVDELVTAIGEALHGCEQ